MIRIPLTPRLQRLREFAAALLLGMLPVLALAQTASSAASAPAPTVRAEVAKPLQAAQELIRAGNYKDALAKVDEAAAKPDLTPYESLLVLRLKAPAAYGSGDMALALQSFEGALASPLLTGNDRLMLMESTIKLSVQMKDLPRAVRWFKTYFDEGGSDATLRGLYPQVLGVSGDHAGAVREAKALVQANDAAGRPTPDSLLRTLGASANALGDNASYQLALEHLVVSTPRPDYWADLISRVTRRDGFADERLRLDVYRLMLATGVTMEGDEYVDLAERAQQAGQPIEAKRALDNAAGQGLLGQIKNQAALQKLRDQVAKAAAQDLASLDDSEKSALAAKDGNSLVNLGLAVWSSGAAERAAGLMNQGIAKGGLRRPDEAQLRLGMVLASANRTDDAQRAFAAVAGGDGSADLARLWTLHLKSTAVKK